MQSPRRHMNLMGMLFPGIHMGAWRMPDASPDVDMNIEHYLELARICEAAKLDGLFFADAVFVLRSDELLAGDLDGSITPRCTSLEPATLLAALAMVTKHLGLVATMTTTYNEPYNVARRFATLDHISRGRIGWNVVTSQNESEAGNFGFDHHMLHADRYERAEEFVDVVRGLWHSWDEGAIIRNKNSGKYFDPSKLRILDHKGKFFKVRGPLNVDRTAEGEPVLFQAGSSDIGKAFAARIADVIFTAQVKLEDAKAFREELRQRTSEFGRDPDSIRVMPGLKLIIGDTEAEARDLQAHLRCLIPVDQAVAALNHLSGGLDLRKFDPDGPLPELPEANSAKARQALMVKRAREERLTLGQVAQLWAEGAGHFTLVGTPMTMADTMERWFREGACDGFNFDFYNYPTAVRAVMDKIVPELQNRGLFRTEYEGNTLRENLGIAGFEKPLAIIGRTCGPAS